MHLHAYHDQASRAHALHLGMWVFLGSETLLFAALFGLYAAFRAGYGAQFVEAAAYNEQWLGSVNTLVLIVSSGCVALAVQLLKADRPRAAALGIVGTIVLGLTFLGLKAYEYSHHLAEGIAPGHAYAFEELPTPGAVMFFTMYYTMTGLHALHVVAGLTIMAWLLLRLRRKTLTAADPTTLELGGLYWHLVDVVWIFLWPLLYLTH